MDLPEFPYHPNPLATGAIELSDAECMRCGQRQGHIYSGPVYSVDEVDGICAWCIADGSAAEAFDAMFTDDWCVPDGVPLQTVEAVTRRTPGFRGWQQERWMYHCDDAAAFRGLVGYAELQHFPDAIEPLRHEHDGLGWSERQVDDYLRALTPVGSPTAYLFTCLHCGTALAYSDFT